MTSDKEYLNMRQQLRALVDSEHDPAPSEVLTRTMLRDAIANEKMRHRLRELTQQPDAAVPSVDRPWEAPPGRSPKRRTAIAAAAIVAVVAMLATGGLLLAPTPVSAFDQLARLVVLLPDDQFSEPASVREWNEERLVIVTGPLDQPVPVLASVKRTDEYDRAGLMRRTEITTGFTLVNQDDNRHVELITDQLDIGATDATVFAQSESDESSTLRQTGQEFLDVAITDHERHGDTATPLEAFLLDRIVSIYTVALPSPAERAAMLDSIGRLGLEARTTATKVTAVFSHDGPFGSETRTLTFDQRGWLVESTLTFDDGVAPERVPPGTTTVIVLEPPD